MRGLWLVLCMMPPIARLVGGVQTPLDTPLSILQGQVLLGCTLCAPGVPMGTATPAHRQVIHSLLLVQGFLEEVKSGQTSTGQACPWAPAAQVTFWTEDLVTVYLEGTRGCFFSLI